ncbi:MAG: hypothetical protein ACI837_001534 [Crocinitomicaceae bacterium]|jgi:hypothetical protein
MKLKKTLTIGLFLLSVCSFGIYAQESQVAGGGEATSISGTGSLSYSIGQVFYTSEITPSGSVSLGVQQAYEIYPILGLEYQDQMTLNCAVYPNPTIDFLTLDVNDYPAKGLSYELFDLTGKVITREKLKGQQTVIEMRDLPNAIYFLKVTDNNNVLGAFKIIKK